MFGLGPLMVSLPSISGTARIHRHPDVDEALIPHRRI